MVACIKILNDDYKRSYIILHLYSYMTPPTYSNISLPIIPSIKRWNNGDCHASLQQSSKTRLKLCHPRVRLEADSKVKNTSSGSNQLTIPLFLGEIDPQIMAYSTIGCDITNSCWDLTKILKSSLETLHQSFMSLESWQLCPSIRIGCQLNVNHSPNKLASTISLSRYPYHDVVAWAK